MRVRGHINVLEWFKNNGYDVPNSYFTVDDRVPLPNYHPDFDPDNVLHFDDFDY